MEELTDVFQDVGNILRPRYTEQQQYKHAALDIHEFNYPRVRQITVTGIEL
jgi:hypothetical protein